MKKQLVQIDVSKLMTQLSEKISVTGDVKVSDLLKALALALAFEYEDEK